MPITAAERFEELLDDRRKDPRCDVELWRFMDQISRNLRNLSDDDLTDRWRGIAKNILYLVDPARDAEPIGAKALSSWWWLQTLVHTEAELGHRNLPKPNVPDIFAPITLRTEFRVNKASSPRFWARVGESAHLLKMLHEGEIRFRAASSYDDPALDPARKDRELEKIRKRPGQTITIVLPNGRQSMPIGDVSYSQRSAIEVGGTLRDVEYWISSWSCEFDPRLFAEFTSGTGPACDAGIIVWDTMALAERTEAAVSRDLVGWLFADIAIRYFDSHDLQQSDALSASMEKDFSYGYQRELRLALASQHQVEKGSALFLKVGSLADIAGLYSADGHKLGGTGPSTWKDTT
jgi:hypothetical protein